MIANKTKQSFLFTFKLTIFSEIKMATILLQFKNHGDKLFHSRKNKINSGRDSNLILLNLIKIKAHETKIRNLGKKNHNQINDEYQ